MFTTLTDAALVAQARAGDERAIEAIVLRHRPFMLVVARVALAGTTLDAEDAVQDVLAKLPRALRAHDRPLLLRPWLRTIVRNRCLDPRRAHRPLVELPLELIGAASADPAVVAERRQDVLRVVRAVRGLPDRQRRALVMHAVEGVPQAEVALALGTSVAATKNLVSRSRQALRTTTTPIGVT
jgi:RNA polymerase sigma-70 factor, ECF subfamily